MRIYRICNKAIISNNKIITVAAVGLYSRFSELNTNFVLQWQYKPGSSIYLVYSLNKFVNGRIFSDYFDFLKYNQPSNWEEILFDQSIYFKIDYWFNI